MTRRTRWIGMASAIAAVIVFLIVQDRVTAGGASEYVDRQRAAAVGQVPAVSIDEVMRPAVRRSVRLGLTSGGAVLAVGLLVAGIVSRIERRAVR